MSNVEDEDKPPGKELGVEVLLVVGGHEGAGVLLHVPGLPPPAPGG